MSADRMVDEESVRIMNCINSCWPELPFTLTDLRKPTGDKFRELLLLFLKGIIGGSYQLPSANLQEFSRNPEMFGHMDGNIALFREVNKLLKSLCYYNFRHVDLVRPSPNIFREVLSVLVNFMAFFENEESNKEKIEDEMRKYHMNVLDCEKLLDEEARHLDKCKQVEEEGKIVSAELREILLKYKENQLLVEKDVSKLENFIREANKRIKATNQRLEEIESLLKNLEQEKEKAAEAVVPDPDALEADLYRSRDDKKNMEADLACLKSRLPTLEQQIADRTAQLKERQETHQRLAQVKIRETIIKAEMLKSEKDCLQVEEENAALVNQLKSYSNLIESKKRMLEDYNLKLEQLRESLEKARSDLKLCSSEEECRKAQQESRIKALENDIDRTDQDSKLAEKALEEGAIILEEIKLKQELSIQQIKSNWETRFEDVIKLLEETFPG